MYYHRVMSVASAFGSRTCPVVQSKLTQLVVQAVMHEPVIAADGHTYEQDAIQGWLQHSTSSPVEGCHLKHTRLVPNVLVRKLLQNITGRP